MRSMHPLQKARIRHDSWGESITEGESLRVSLNETESQDGSAATCVLRLRHQITGESPEVQGRVGRRSRRPREQCARSSEEGR